MNDQPKTMREQLAPLELEDVETLELKIRNINGEGVLFTKDGKMVGHQVAQFGHYYYKGTEPDRVKMFRATFVVDHMPSDMP